jgi:hypothetical protein
MSENHISAEAVEVIWARQLDAEQLAARLIANAQDYRWSPIPQRVALLNEAAARLFEGTPRLGKAPLPTKAAAAEAVTDSRTAETGGPVVLAPNHEGAGEPHVEVVGQVPQAEPYREPTEAEQAGAAAGAKAAKARGAKAKDVAQAATDAINGIEAALAADASAAPEAATEESAIGTGRTGRGRVGATGDPRADRAKASGRRGRPRKSRTDRANELQEQDGAKS